MRTIMKALGGMTCPDSFGDHLITYSCREIRLKEASHDLRMAIRCIRDCRKLRAFPKLSWIQLGSGKPSPTNDGSMSLMRWDGYLQSRKRLPSWCKPGV